MSFLKELRDSVDESLNAKPLVNDEKNTQDDQPDEVNKVNNTERDVANPGDAGEVVQQDLSINDEHEELMKLKSIAKVEEVRNILENEKSMEADNPLIKLILKDAERSTGVSFEAYSNRKELLRAIGKWNVSVEASKIMPFTALKDVIRDGWVKFRNYDYFKAVYDHEIFNKVKTDLMSNAVYFLKVLGSSELASNIDKDFKAASKNIDKSNLPFVFNGGKLIDGVQLANDTLAAMRELINIIPQVDSSGIETFNELLKKFKVASIFSKIPNMEITTEGDSLGMKMLPTKAGEVKFEEFKDYVINTDAKLPDYAKEVRRLESDLHKEIDKLEKDGSPLAKAYAQTVTQLALFVGTYFVESVSATVLSFNQVLIQALEKQDNLDESSVGEIKDVNNVKSYLSDDDSTGNGDSSLEELGSKLLRVLKVWVKTWLINISAGLLLTLLFPPAGGVFILVMNISAIVKTAKIVLESNREQYLKDLNQIKGALALAELDKALAKSPSLESNNELIQMHLDTIEAQYGVSIEEDESGKKSIRERIRDKVSAIGKKIKEWGEIIDDKFSGLDKVSGYLTKLKALDNEQQKAFMERFNSKESKYLTESGKLVLPNALIKEIRGFDSLLANGTNKMVGKFITSIKKLENQTFDLDVLLNTCRELTTASGLIGKTFKLPGIKVEVVGKEQQGVSNVDFELNVTESKAAIKSNNDFKDVVKYLEEVNEGWSSFRKLSKENKNSWNKIVSILDKESEGFGSDGNTDMLFELQITTFVHIMKCSKLIGQLFDNSKKHFTTTVSMVGSSLNK